LIQVTYNLSNRNESSYLHKHIETFETIAWTSPVMFTHHISQCFFEHGWKLSSHIMNWRPKIPYVHTNLRKLCSCYFEKLEDHILWTVYTSAILFARDISIYYRIICDQREYQRHFPKQLAIVT
jgi:hypothetical protein